MPHKFLIRIYFFSCIILFACKSNGKSNIPALNLQLSDSTTIISTSRIPAGQAVVMIFFSPDCEHCQKETEYLLKNMKAVKPTQFYFITEDPLDRMRLFNEYYNIPHYPNITLGRDFNFEFLKHYDITTTPVTMLYNKTKQLKLTFKGLFPADTIIAAINNL